MVFVSSHSCLVDGTFRLFAVTHDNEGMIVLVVHFCSQRHTDAYREPVSQSTAVDFDSGNRDVGMSAKVCVVGSVSIQFLVGNESFVIQHRVQCFCTMTFAQHKAVAVFLLRILRIDIQNLVVEYGQHVQYRQVATGMSCSSFINQPQQPQSQLFGFQFHFFIFHFFFNYLPQSS